MTALKREQILQAITATLVGTAQVGSRIYRSRADAFARNEAPALAIEVTQDDPATEPVSFCKIDWTLTVDVVVHTRGLVPDQLAAPIIASLHSKLLADRTLGGLVISIWPGPVSYAKESADQTAGWATCTYLVKYRSNVQDLTS